MGVDAANRFAVLWGMLKTHTLLLSEESAARLEAWQKQLPADRMPPSQETKIERRRRLQGVARLRRRYTGIRLTRPRKSPATKELILNNVTIDSVSGCWEWNKGKNAKGYGKVRHFGKTDRVHRVAWELWNGPIPQGLKALHHCDNPPCCNPGHLFVGTGQENMRDAAKKERKNKKLTFDQVIKILGDDRKYRVIAGELGISEGYVSEIKRHKKRTIVPNRFL